MVLKEGVPCWANLLMIMVPSIQRFKNLSQLSTSMSEVKSLASYDLLLTEREGRTGEYWPEVVAVRGPYKNDRGPIFPSTARAS